MRKEGELANRRLSPGIERCFDIAAGCFALGVLAIPFIIIAIAIKLESRGSVFYKQPRAGKGGKPFHMVKFRTMVDGAEHMGLGFEVARNDSRITRVGNLLRAWSFDELPQIFNIIDGTMSIVGPRPARMDQIEMFTLDEKKTKVAKLTGMIG